MPKRSKANPAVPVQSKLEMLEKRRLLSTALAVNAPVVVADIASLSDGAQPVTGAAASSDAPADNSTAILDLSSDALAGDTTATDSSAISATDPTVLPSEPIPPISFDDVVSPVVDPASVVVDITMPIEPVKFVDPTLPPVTVATDPTADVDPTVLPIDPITPEIVPVDGTLSSTDTSTTQDGTTADPAAPIDTTISTSTPDPLGGADTGTLPDPLSTVDPTTSTTTTPATDSQTITPVVVTVPIVDQTDLGDSPPPGATTTSSDWTSGSTSDSTSTSTSTPTSSSSTDSSDTTTASSAPVAQPVAGGQSSSDQAMDSDASFMHVSLPPVLGGSHDGVSGFHPVYVSVASNAQQPSSSAAHGSMLADASEAQPRTSVHENLVTGTTTSATQGTFSTTPIQQAPIQQAPIQPTPIQQAAGGQGGAQQAAVQQAVEPVAPPEAAPALDGDAVAAVVERDMDVTGPREEVAPQLAEEHLKLTRLVWTFPTIDAQPQATEAAAQQPPAQTAGAKVAPVAANTSDAGPAVIQLVQEIDVSPADAAAQAAAQAAGKVNPHVVQIPPARASLTNSLNDSANRSRNIVLAVAAGVASLAVQSYRSSRRKLAAAARAAHLDPLAAWLDDPEFDRRG